MLHNDLAELDKLRHGSKPGLARAYLRICPSIHLRLEEAVANVIMYGAARMITWRLQSSCGPVVARIDDTGRPFDPTQVPPPALATSLAEAEVGSFGIHLMRSFGRFLHYERRDGRNRLTLQFVELQAVPHRRG